jgi:hypothetical protein
MTRLRVSRASLAALVAKSSAAPSAPRPSSTSRDVERSGPRAWTSVGPDTEVA